MSEKRILEVGSLVPPVPLDQAFEGHFVDFSYDRTVCLRLKSRLFYWDQDSK